MKWFCLLAIFFSLLLSADLLKDLKVQKFLNTSLIPADYDIEVPFDFAIGIPIVEVKIQGESYRFLFDTGAVSLLDKKLAKKLGISGSKDDALPALDAAGSVGQMNTSILPELEIAGLTIRDLGVGILDLNPKEGLIQCGALDGILGYKCLSKSSPRLKSTYKSRQSMQYQANQYI